MGFRSAIIGRLHITLWAGPQHHPQLGDADAILEELRRARAVQGNLLFVSLIARNSDPPTEVVRREFSAKLPQLFELIDHAYAIIEGDGITSTLNRALIRAMATLSSHRRQMSICSSIDDVLAKASDIRATPEQVRGALARLRSEVG
jgi:hypothetical protein